MILLQPPAPPIVRLTGVQILPGIDGGLPRISIQVNGVDWAGLNVIVNGAQVFHSLTNGNNQVEFTITHGILHEGVNNCFLQFLDSEGRIVAVSNIVPVILFAPV